jgi:hypothetical protein
MSTIIHNADKLTPSQARYWLSPNLKQEQILLIHIVILSKHFVLFMDVVNWFIALAPVVGGEKALNLSFCNNYQ